MYIFCNIFIHLNWKAASSHNSYQWRQWCHFQGLKGLWVFSLSIFYCSLQLNETLVVFYYSNYYRHNFCTNKVWFVYLKVLEPAHFCFCYTVNQVLQDLLLRDCKIVQYRAVQSCKIVQYLLFTGLRRTEELHIFQELLTCLYRHTEDYTYNASFI